MVNLTKRQQNILIGTILGDGCLEVNGRNVRLKVDHSISQKELTYWVYKEFENLCSREPYYLDQYSDKAQKFYHHYRFSTLSLSNLNPYYETFYLHKKKIVPKNITKILTNPLSLAVWYMDDGFRRTDCSSLYLCTSAFTNEEQILLMEALKKNFDLDAKVHYAAGNARIYIPASSAKRFCEIVEEFIVPDLSYKLISHELKT